MGEYISLQFAKDKTIYFIHPDTGEFHSTFELTAPFKNTYNLLHINSDGFAYQIVNKEQGLVLIGGEIIGKKWTIPLESEDLGDSFLSFTTHCGFERFFEDKLVLFGPTGDKMTIQGCMDAKAHGDKLYLIEKDPSTQDKCLLTIRTLSMESDVVSAIEKTISLDVNKASFGDLCKMDS